MIAVLQRTFLLLEVFAEQGDPISLARLTQASGLPKPTIYRMLQSLVELGYLAQNSEDGQYLRTPALEHLGCNNRHEYLRHRARPAMESLLNRFNETVALATLEGTQVRYLLVLETTRLLRRIPPTDRKEPYYATALGRAIAAFLPPQDQRILVELTRPAPLTPRTVRSKRRLLELLAQTRDQGWSFQGEELEEGTCCIAVPILEDGQPVAALGLTVPRVRCGDRQRRSMIEALKAIGL